MGGTYSVSYKRNGQVSTRNGLSEQSANELRDLIQKGVDIVKPSAEVHGSESFFNRGMGNIAKALKESLIAFEPGDYWFAISTMNQKCPSSEVYYNDYYVCVYADSIVLCDESEEVVLLETDSSSRIECSIFIDKVMELFKSRYQKGKVVLRGGAK